MQSVHADCWSGVERRVRRAEVDLVRFVIAAMPAPEPTALYWTV